MVTTRQGNRYIAATIRNAYTAIFVEEYTYQACDPKVRQQVLKLSIDCTGTRATGRILGISKDTVTAILKKQKVGHGR